MDGFIIFVLIVGGVIALIVWGVNAQKKIRQKWFEFAQANGLEYTGGISASANPHIAGWYNRTHVTINTVTRGSGKNRSTFTQFNGHVNVPMPNGLNLVREGFFNKVGKFFGGQDVQLGDAQLDAAFLIKAHDVVGAFNLMRIPQVKQALLTFLARHPGMQLNERHLMFEENGVCGDMARMKAAIDDLTYLGQTIEAGYNELLASQGKTPRAQPGRQTRAHSKTGLRPAPSGNTAHIAAVATAAAAAGMVHEQNQAALAEQGREAAILKAKLAAEAALRQAEHDKKMREYQAAREQRLAEAEAERDATLTAATLGNRPVAGDAGRRTPAEQRAVSQFADAFHQLEAKMVQESAFRAEDVAKPETVVQSSVSTGGSVAEKANAVAAVTNDVFAKSSTDFAMPSTAEAFTATKFEPPKFTPPKFEPPKFESKFATPARAEASPAGEPNTFEELVARLSDSKLFSSDREKLVSRFKERVFVVKIDIERVERTFGFDLPEKLRDGRTVEGRIPGKDVRVAARYPASENERLDHLQSGTSAEVQGYIASWDDLFKKAVLNAL